MIIVNFIGLISSLFLTLIAVQLNEVFLPEESSIRTFSNKILFIIAFCEVIKILIELVKVLVTYFGSIT